MGGNFIARGSRRERERVIEKEELRERKKTKRGVIVSEKRDNNRQ